MKRPVFALACLLIFTGAAGTAKTSLRPVLAANDWLNARATAGTLAGEVVVLDVFTVDATTAKTSCPSCECSTRETAAAA